MALKNINNNTSQLIFDFDTVEANKIYGDSYKNRVPVILFQHHPNVKPHNVLLTFFYQILELDFPFLLTPIHKKEL